MEKERSAHAGLYRNAISLYGAIIAGGSLLLILFAVLLQFTAQKPSPYLGIFTFLIFPAFFMVGAILFLYGMRRESLRRRRAGSDEALPYPRLDLNDSRQRKRFGYFSMGGIFVAILLAFTTYNAFLYSESVSFCGTLCHTVMKPEYTAYLVSPHARVRCVDCHIGEGAEWFVKAKISGLRQVAAVTFGSYERPIPTPIENLRPARETCEECHWPAKFFGTQLVQRPHFRYDAKNTPEQISLGVKTGGGSPETGGAGIHWHMVMENRITFAAADRKKQEIPLVEVRDPQGRLQVEYLSTEYKGTADQLSRMRRYPIDCIECHNRPTHIFIPPETAVDQAMVSGFISPALPWAKKVVVDALAREYPSNDKAHQGLAAEIGGFYQKNHPDVFASRKAAMDNAVAAATAIYDRSVFPEMRVNWQTYPSNISHRNWPGCFRCHDGKHVSKTGKVLGNGCTTCHTEPIRSQLMPMGTVTLQSGQPWHPV
ncbi:MAG: NapC/NirT family cytochrome c, partial [Deltaproteobacteria bacterium]|nr:NapC/NirT family cytochrome c [Deltaproteobacteria bacterium]